MRNETTPRTPTYRYPFHISCFSSTNSMSRLRSWGLARTRKMQTSCRTAPAMKKVQKVRTRGPSRLMFSVPFRYRFLSHYKQIYIYIYIYIRKKAIYTFFLNQKILCFMFIKLFRSRIRVKLYLVLNRFYKYILRINGG